HLFRESGEPPECGKSPRLREIRDYNREDCESTRDLTSWLRARQADAGISWMAPNRDPERADPEKASKLPEEDQAAAALAADLLGEIPSDPDARKLEENRWRVQEILAQLLCFHRREEKPMWWELYERRDKTHEQLAEDEACLGDLRLEPGPPVMIKRSRGWWYRFDSRQETKLVAGKKCRFSHDLTVHASIESLDREARRVLVKIGDAAIATLEGRRPPALVSLIPDEFVSQTSLKEAIFDLVSAWEASGTLPRHLEDVILRRAARVRGHLGGPLLHPGEDATEGAVRMASSLDGTT